MGVRQSKLLVAISLLPTLCAFAADRKHKQPMTRQLKTQFVAFAYTSEGLTSEGRKPVAGKTIAADPRVLPMGTLVRISGAGPWSGEYRVGDIGSAIKGNKVDVFVPSRMEAMEFGRRKVLITVLEKPVRTAPAEATRARTAEEGQCRGCGAGAAKAIMARDEARQPSVNPAGSVATGRAGISSQRSDSGKSRGTAALVRVSAVQGASFN